MLAPSAARLSAISRPTPLVAPVTKAICPFSPRSMFALSRVGCPFCGVNQAKQTFRRYRKLVDLNAERRERVCHRIRYRRRRTNGAAFAHAAKAAERRRRHTLEMYDFHRRNLAGRRNKIVYEARGMELALLVVDDQRIDQPTAILGDGVTINANLVGLRIDLDGRDVGRRCSGAEHWIVSI